MSLYIRSPITKIVLGIAAVLLTIVVLLLIGITEENRMALQAGNWQGRSIEGGAALFANNCATCHGADGKGLQGVAPALHSNYFFTHRLEDVGWPGSLLDYVKLTVAAGRPSKKGAQWAQMMPTWSRDFGGPLRPDQVDAVAHYVVNWQEDALQQTAETDPWQPFLDIPKPPEQQTIGAPKPVATAVPAGAGPRPPQELFTSLGCIGCHNLTLNQTPDSRGAVGPNMGNLYDHAGARVPGQDAETYVHNSIVNPNEFVVPGYLPNLMVQGLADKMTPEELNALVKWLLDPNRAQ